MANTDTVCSNPEYIRSVNMRKRWQLFNRPPPRANPLDTNPYEQDNPTTGQRLTSFDLAMRRKAEILGYKSNRMTTQTNSLTNAGRYAALMTGAYQRRTYSGTYIQQNTQPDGTIASACATRRTLTSECGVPGPIMQLYYDPDVPLVELMTRYNYAEENRSDAVDPWFYEKSDSILIQNTSSDADRQYATVVSIFILKRANTSYAYTLLFPYRIHVTASKKENVFGTYNGGNVTFNIQMKCDVFYGDGIVQSLDATTVLPAFVITPSGGATYDANIYCGTATAIFTLGNVSNGQIYDIKPYAIITTAYANSGDYSAYYTIPVIQLTINCLTANTTYAGCTGLTTTPSTITPLALSGVGVGNSV